MSLTLFRLIQTLKWVPADEAVNLLIRMCNIFQGIKYTWVDVRECEGLKSDLHVSIAPAQKQGVCNSLSDGNNIPTAAKLIIRNLICLSPVSVRLITLGSISVIY